ncbi:hypothetical protein CEUSTIGMA_g4637.t1 [Chlamydomonas eustigma]|uniref:Pseudouridine synthase RsuA/RluA-like domain-containing protein n=1 Tax=Chlamydomonas eustigma TaxID=1157962 RepID=A0A250X294_9CHLO|nr:hypothetical protein CEUSTIGMA_g4637.t1 [Chlamydomonas eustigma]|eukprot:GAX77191.1 hypothetical protein CEUSTIGMA_g4637.t1 [Chlamydomonas eustigma]
MLSDVIQLRIQESRQRRAARPQPLKCPSCGSGVGTPPAMLKHLQSCCPDLLSSVPDTMVLSIKGGDRCAAEQLLSAAVVTEQAAREEILRLKFRSGSGSLQQSEEENGQQALALDQVPIQLIADVMGLPLKRATELLHRAMREYPMPADPEPVEVLYEDDHLLAVNKPTRLNSAPAHRYKGGSMVNRVIGHLGHPPYTIHRLDMDTSGIMLFAKSREAVEPVAVQFRKRTVKKYYLALCIGVPEQRCFEVKTPIGLHPQDPIARACYPDETAGSLDSSENHWEEGGEIVSTRLSSDDLDIKHAWTSFQVIDSNPDIDLSTATPGSLFEASHKTNLRGVSLVACMLHTGRTHQIRVHCQHVGHPLIGDELYGVLGPWISRQALHASLMLLQHPTNNNILTLRAPLPLDMRNALHGFGIQAMEFNIQDFE